MHVGHLLWGYVGGGYVFFLFRKKERTKEKSIGSFSRMGTFYSFYGLRFSLYERRRAGTALIGFSAMSQRLLLNAIIRGSRDSLF